jgi:hypothetical protein
MVAVPPLTAVTTPVLAPTVATAPLLLLQVPPVVVELNVVELPTHTISVPVIAAGVAPTVNTIVVKHVADIA